MTGIAENSTWHDYVLGRGEDVDGILVAAAGMAPLHLVIGDGFDQRALHILGRILDLELDLRVTTIPLPSGVGHGASSALAARNRAELEKLRSRHGFDVVRAEEPDGTEPLTAGARQAKSLIADGAFTSGETIVIDISALPTSRFFPLIGAIAQRVEEEATGELVVTVAENPELDLLIRSEGTSEPGAISGFHHGLRIDDPDTNKIWAPILGESSMAELQAIYEFLRPDEMYPILPFPARDPRRADRIVLEHRGLLFDEFETASRNILYVQEANPFDCYRVLRGLYVRSCDLLAPLGDVQVTASVHASKMLSIGACLASIEQPIPIVTASGSHHLAKAPDDEWVRETTEMTAIWLQGSPYRS